MFCYPLATIHYPLFRFLVFDLDWSSLVFRFFRSLCAFRTLGRASTEAAFVFDVETFWHGRNFGSGASQLAAIAQHDFGMPVVLFDVSLDFDRTAFQPANIAHVTQVTAKDDYLKR